MKNKIDIEKKKHETNISRKKYYKNYKKRIETNETRKGKCYKIILKEKGKKQITKKKKQNKEQKKEKKLIVMKKNHT
jgi:hypothetical protein